MKSRAISIAYNPGTQRTSFALTWAGDIIAFDALLAPSFCERGMALDESSRLQPTSFT